MANVLVVDDELAIRASLRMILEKANYQVVEASNGRDAREKFAPGRFNLIITDIIMPDEEGISFIRGVRDQDPNIKILAISGGGRTANAEFLDMAVKLGANASLKKPFTADALRKVIEQLLPMSGS